MFLNILNWYNEYFTKPWFYGVSLAKDNTRSLAAALILNLEESEASHFESRNIQGRL